MKTNKYFLLLLVFLPLLFLRDFTPDNELKYLSIADEAIRNGNFFTFTNHVTKEQTYALMEQFRKEVPGIHLRTTLMVGHPGETEADFEELKEFVKRVRFDRMGAFTYSGASLNSMRFMKEAGK